MKDHYWVMKEVFLCTCDFSHKHNEATGIKKLFNGWKWLIYYANGQIKDKDHMIQHLNIWHLYLIKLILFIT